MRVALIADTHWGVRNDDRMFVEEASLFFRDQFFPTISGLGIDTVIHLGDTFDRRRFINYQTLRTFLDVYIEGMRGKRLITVIGNHDVYYKDVNDVNSIDMLVRPYQPIVIDEPTTMDLGGTSALLVPWISPDNSDRVHSALRASDASLLFGHFEMKGFRMSAGQPLSDFGMERSSLDHFDAVFSGHYHHRSTVDNFTYLGCPYEMTWADANDPKGFAVIDTDTGQTTFYDNRRRLHRTIQFDGSAPPDTSELGGKIVRVLVDRTSVNPYALEQFMSRLEEDGVSDARVVQQETNIAEVAGATAAVDGVDRRGVIRDFVMDRYVGHIDRSVLAGLMVDLYDEVTA